MAERQTLFAKHPPVAMGPCVRRDDNECAARSSQVSNSNKHPAMPHPPLSANRAAAFARGSAPALRACCRSASGTCRDSSRLRSSSLRSASRAACRSWRAITAARKRLMRRRRRASKTAVRQANGLVAEVGMVFSIVMAIFFQTVAGTRRSCRHPFYRRPAASMVSAAFGASA